MSPISIRTLAPKLSGLRPRFMPSGILVLARQAPNAGPRTGEGAAVDRRGRRPRGLPQLPTKSASIISLRSRSVARELGRAPAEARRFQSRRPAIRSTSTSLRSPSDRRQQGGVERGIPSEQARIRAYLSPSPQGGWEGRRQRLVRRIRRCGRQTTPRRLSAPRRWARDRSARLASGPGPHDPGKTGRRRPIRSAPSGRMVLKVIDVLPDTPAKAGFETGDVIIGATAGSSPISNQFTELLTQGAARWPTWRCSTFEWRAGDREDRCAGAFAEAPTSKERPEAGPQPGRVAGHQGRDCSDRACGRPSGSPRSSLGVRPRRRESRRATSSSRPRRGDERLGQPQKAVERAERP